MSKWESILKEYINKYIKVILKNNNIIYGLLVKILNTDYSQVALFSNYSIYCPNQLLEQQFKSESIIYIDFDEIIMVENLN